MKISVIGGGAAGLTAAIVCKRKSPFYEIEIFEKLDRAGKKILATGNGRCNLTNESVKVCNYRTDNTGYVENIIKKYNTNEILEFFKGLGLLFYTGEKGRIYPRSLQAASVIDVLRLECERLGIKIMPGSKVESIKKTKNGFAVKANGKEYFCDKVVIAAGGESGENLGSDGDGIRLLSSMGHKIIKTFPSLVQIRTENGETKSLNGLKMNISARLYNKDNRLLFEDTGEMHFANYGLSGPLAFNMSYSVSRALSRKEKGIFASLDFMREFSFDETLSFLKERTKTMGDKPLEVFLTGVFPKMCSLLLMKNSTDKKLNVKTSSLSENDILSLAKNIKEFKVLTTGVMPFKNSQATAGGGDLSEFNKNTLESEKIRGLYACGEVLDVVGDCGGYNLHFAWASGMCVGENL